MANNIKHLLICFSYVYLFWWKIIQYFWSFCQAVYFVIFELFTCSDTEVFRYFRCNTCKYFSHVCAFSIHSFCCFFKRRLFNLIKVNCQLLFYGLWLCCYSNICLTKNCKIVSFVKFIVLVSVNHFKLIFVHS